MYGACLVQKYNYIAFCFCNTALDFNANST
jgi:hypothetical protein